MGRHRISIFGLVSLAAASLVGVVSSTIAWFRDTVELAPDVVTGAVQGAYYAGGDGSSGNPFQIHDPIHLYNLAWLQYFGTYNKFTSNTLTSQTYFVVTADLDMTGWTLPPIGTEDCPFLGKFDGGGHTITGLTSTNEFDIGSGIKTPQKFTGFGVTYHQPQIVGFFGVVGKLPGETYTYTSANNQMINYTLNGTKVESRTSQTLIGIAAGYVNATMNGVKVTGAATIDVNGASASTAVDAANITENLSDYGLVGYTANTGGSSTYQQKLSAYYNSTDSTGGGSGQQDEWGGSFNSRDYTTWIYSVNHSATSETTNTVSGQGGYVVKKTASDILDPANNQIVYRLRDGSYLPLKFTDDQKTRAALSNTGYLVGSNIGTGPNASPKISSYAIRNIVNSIYDTKYYNNMSKVYDNKDGTVPAISYTDSNLEILTYSNTKINNKNWVRIKDTHNSSHNSVNPGLSGYTKSDSTTPEALGFEKYTASRDALQSILSGNSFVHGIHFDNNAVSSSNVLNIPENTARIGGSNIATQYPVPKGSINFKLKQTGFINFFAATYNSSNIALNFFSLNHVVRNASNGITSIKPITQIYLNSSWNSALPSNSSTNPKFRYKYSDNSYSSGTTGALQFDVSAALGGNSPVNNAMYYFEVPVNDGEYAMGVSGSTQGAYMIYLDIGANGDKVATDTVTAYSITTIRNSNLYPAGVDFAPVTVAGDGGESVGMSIAASKKGVLTLTVTTSPANIAVTDASSIAEYAFQGTKYSATSPPSGYFSMSGNLPTPMVVHPAGGERVLTISLTTVSEDEYDIRITDQLDAEGDVDSSTYELDSGSGYATSNAADIEDLSEEIVIDDLRALEIAATLTRASGKGEFVTTYDTENCTADTIDVDITLNGTVISVAVTAGYTFKIGGTAYANSSTYPTS